MERSAESDTRVRLLGLGNEILADDAFGLRVARAVERDGLGFTDVVCSSSAGFELLDQVLETDHLIVVDTIMTGRARPGTLHIVREPRANLTAAVAPHFVGLWEVLAVGRRLGLPVPAQTTIVAVEAADCTTVGGSMDPRVEASIAGAVTLVRQVLSRPQSSSVPAG